MNPANIAPYIAPYVQVRHAIHLLYATSPHYRELAADLGLSVRLDKHGKRLPLELHGCGCSLCARTQRRRLNLMGSPREWGQ